MPIPVAEAVALPVLPASPAKTSLAAVLSGASSPSVAKNVPVGTTSWTSKVNTNAAMLDALASAFGDGIMGPTGLELSASGLTLTVQSGFAIIGGVVELALDTEYTLPASQALVAIWLKRDGTLAHTLTTAAPAYSAVLLGTCATGVSGVTGDFDTAGVIRITNGQAWRETGDVGAPADTLAAAQRGVFTLNASGQVYVWTGTAHVLVG